MSGPEYNLNLNPNNDAHLLNLKNMYKATDTNRADAYEDLADLNDAYFVFGFPDNNGNLPYDRQLLVHNANDFQYAMQIAQQTGWDTNNMVINARGIYVVEEGDRMGRVRKDYGISEQRLTELNYGKDQDDIDPGDRWEMEMACDLDFVQEVFGIELETMQFEESIPIIVLSHTKGRPNYHLAQEILDSNPNMDVVAVVGIVPGDSYYDFGKTLQMPYSQIMQFNGVSDTDLQNGDLLMLPIKNSQHFELSEGVLDQSGTDSHGRKFESNPTVYVPFQHEVSVGEKQSIQTICEFYGITPQLFELANPTFKNQIYVANGQKVTILLDHPDYKPENFVSTADPNISWTYSFPSSLAPSYRDTYETQLLLYTSDYGRIYNGTYTKEQFDNQLFTESHVYGGMETIKNTLGITPQNESYYYQGTNIQSLLYNGQMTIRDSSGKWHSKNAPFAVTNVDEKGERYIDIYANGNTLNFDFFESIGTTRNNVRLVRDQDLSSQNLTFLTNDEAVYRYYPSSELLEILGYKD